MKLEPKPGFDWNRVAWGKPDSVRSALCSYCFAAVPEDSVPLILASQSGHVAQFCRQCQETWWGLVSYDEPADYDDEGVGPPIGIMNLPEAQDARALQKKLAEAMDDPPPNRKERRRLKAVTKRRRK